MKRSILKNVALEYIKDLEKKNFIELSELVTHSMEFSKKKDGETLYFSVRAIKENNNEITVLVSINDESFLKEIFPVTVGFPAVR